MKKFFLITSLLVLSLGLFSTNLRITHSELLHVKEAPYIPGEVVASPAFFEVRGTRDKGQGTRDKRQGTRDCKT